MAVHNVGKGLHTKIKRKGGCMKKKLYLDKKRYGEYVKKRAARSSVLHDCINAALVGGSICAFGEVLLYAYRTWGMPYKMATTGVSVTLIFLAALFTGIGIFDRIARVAGAGTLVPITGFSNAVVSSAIDTKSEGWIMGVGAKIFTIAGPVILYGSLCGTVYGIIYYIVRWFV